MNYQELKNAIIEVIRTNGNEEITGEVLQFVLLEMVSSLGKDFQFAGVATPQTEIIERDDKVAWVLGAGTYENFGIPFTVAVDEIAFVLYNGTYRVQKVKTGVIVDDTLTLDGQNPVKGGAIYAEFEKLRAAGYLFAGVATPSLLPPANLTEKIFYLATQGGEYPNLDNITLTKGINIIRFDGTSWIGESLIAITDEVIDSNVSLITAAGVYSGLSGKVDKAEGMGLSQNSYTNTEKSKLGALPTAQELVQMLGGKQDVLTFDTTPTLNSQNPVTSDGIQRAIEAILILIPSAASALNQLADKSFVNSTVATASATFRGTYNLVSDLSLAVTATHAQIAAALAGAVSGADNNDYCFVQIPTSAGTPTEIRVTERYKFNGTAWAYEYDLNNSGFTAAQWEAINSGITALLVTKLSNLPNATELAALFAGKQNTLTFDNAPVSGSSNPVKSGGIYDAIAAITAVIPSTATSSNKLVDLNALTAYVTGIIGALDASFDLTSTDGHVTLKMTQVDGVITTLQILTSDIASAQALATLSGQVSTNADDIAALQALYNALQQSAPEIIEPTDTWPVASPSDTVIYRVIDRVNTPPQYYSDYMFKADDLTTPVLMATYNNAIDAVPTAGSHNLVESGGVQNELALGAVYDVSAKNPTAGPNYDGKFESLAALLSDANLNTLIPDAYRKGGMSIKFVQSSDNKYVQYRLMSDTFNTTPANWQGIDDEPTAGSDNLVKSCGVASVTDKINQDITVNDHVVLPLIATRNLRPASNGVVRTGDNGYSYIAKVNQGDALTINFTIVSGTYIRCGFTSQYPTNGASVTGYVDAASSAHKLVIASAPITGYLLMECQSDFTELSVSKDNTGTIGRNVFDLNKEVDELNGIINQEEIITPQVRSGYYIKFSDSKLYEGSSFSVTEPIQIRKGEKITVVEAAVNSSIAVISTCDSSLGNISAKVQADAQHLDIYTYEYKAQADGYVSVCYQSTYPPTITIGNNIAEEIEGLALEVDAIAYPLDSKNFGVDGDSITAGEQWSKIVADNLHFNTHHNVGVGGATWACNVVTYNDVEYTPQEYDDPNFAGIGNGSTVVSDPTTAQQVANNCAKVHVQKFIAEVTAGTYPEPDVFCFSFGTNDFVPTQEQVSAAMAATDYPTGDALFNMAGAMRWCLQKIRETYPECTIFVLLPIQRSWTKYWYNDGKSAKVNMIQKSDYIKEIAQDFGVQVINMFHNCGINGCLEKDAPTYGPYLRDGLHPNNDGRKNMGNYATAIIKAFYFQQY